MQGRKEHEGATAEAPLCIAVVGPCASGKSTLLEALRAAGYDARHPAQEHSFVKDMWKRLVDPDLLIYLDVDYAASRRRRPTQDPGEDGLAEQRRRLAHARAHADLYLDTSVMTAEDVQTTVLRWLEEIAGPTQT